MFCPPACCIDLHQGTHAKDGQNFKDASNMITVSLTIRLMRATQESMTCRVEKA